MGKEKRKYKRSPIEMAASFGVPDDQSTNEGITVTDMSRGGFCYTSELPLKKNDFAELSVEVAPGEEVAVKVQGVWSKLDEETGLYMNGVLIVDFSSQDLHKFFEFYFRN